MLVILWERFRIGVRNDNLYKRAKVTRRYYVYILANKHNTVLYIGVTNDLERRVREHRERVASSFTHRYNVHKLVHYEEYTEVRDAIAREKQLKNWHRAWKEELIRKKNPNFQDLSR